jgi:15-cis-phytoene desaturase
VTDADVVVAGAGLAGLACAFELATAGREVLVLEAREVVGGRTSSWDDHGMAVESGLHRMLGVYRAMPNLLERAGVSMDELVCWEDEVEVRPPDGGPDAEFGAAPLHNPVTTLVGLAAKNHVLAPVDKVRLAAFAPPGCATPCCGRAGLTGASWPSTHGHMGCPAGWWSGCWCR